MVVYQNNLLEGFGSNLSADIIERSNQRILIVREKLTSLTLATTVKDQTAETLEEALLPMIMDIMPNTGTTIQTDCATSWAKLSAKLESGPVDPNVTELEREENSKFLSLEWL